MPNIYLKKRENLYTVELLEESHPNLANTLGIGLVPESVISSIYGYFDSKYPFNYVSRDPSTWLVRGVLAKVVKQGHKHFKRIELVSDSKDSLVSLLTECTSGLDLTLHEGI